MIQDRLDCELDYVAQRYRHLFYWQVLAAFWLAAAAVVLASGGLNLNVRRMPPVVLMSLAGGLAAIAAVIWRCGISAPGPVTVARRIEKKYPDLNTCLLAAVEQAPALPHGRYGFLQEAVMEQAVAHAEAHPWWKVISRRRMALAVVSQYATLALFLASLVILLPPSKATLAKQAKRRAAAAAGGEFSVTIEPGNTEIERGSSLLVLARVKGPLPADGTLVYGAASGDVTRLAMSASLDDPIFGGRVATVTQPLEYHVKLGSHVTPTYRVTVFEYPKLERADARLVYPTYTGLEEKLIQDIRTLSVVEGTAVTLICQLNKPVKSARFVEKAAATKGEKPAATDPTKPAPPVAALPDLPLTLRDGNIYEVKFDATQTRRLKLELVDDAGRKNPEESVIVVQVVPNQPPTFKLAFPGRDLEVSPLEELDVKATAWDDYGVKRMGLNFALAGKPAMDVVLGENAAARQRHELANVIRFEDLKAEPDQLLAYHFWAEDIGSDGKLRRTASDMYFAEVRHFDEIFRQGQQVPGGQQQRQQQQGNQNTDMAQKLAQMQKDMINATWKLIRRETGAQPTAPFLDDVDQVSQSQGEALEQATELGEKLTDTESQAHLLAVLEAMQQAVKHLKTAHDQPSLSELQPAMAAEQSAYQALLKLRAREHEVVRQQQQSGSSSSSSQQAGRSQQQRQQMEELDLTDEDKRYEAQRLAQAQQEKPEDRETKQVLNRLRELARRQHDLNERLKDLQSALQEAANEEKKEEIRQQLKRLQDEQRDVLRDTDELQSRMEAPENQERMAEERQQLEQAREQVQRASESLEGEKVTQAAASGTRAEKEFEELRNEFRKRASGQFNEQMRDMRNEARELDQQEKRLAEQLAATTEPGPEKKSLRDDEKNNQSGAIADRLTEQKEKLSNLSERLKQTVQEAEQTEPLLTEKLADAARNLQDQNVERALDVAGRSARQGFLEDAREVEKIAGRGITQLREGIEKAAESVLGDETEALRRAREQLKNLAQELNQEIARNAPEERLPTIPGRDPAAAGEPGQTVQRPNGDAKPGEGREPMPNANGEPQPGAPRTGQGPAAEKPQGQPQPMPGSPPGGQPGATPNGDRQQTEPQPGGQPMPPGQGQRPGQQPGKQPGQQPGQTPGQQPGQPGQQGGQQSGQSPGQQPGQQPGQGGQGTQPGPQPGQPGQRPGQDPQQGGQRGQRGGQPRANQAGLSGGGGLAEGTLEETSSPIAGDDFLEWSDRLRDVEEMVDDPELRAEAARIRDQARSIRAELKRHSKTPNWKLVRANVAEPLVELTNRVADELLRRNSKQAIVPLDRDPVPPKYSEKTRRYYERLGSGK
ncbi:MAG: hypothetical protein JWN70_2006 [Planctomycetaceae bacterium]|nr:hypothetical protein [Planctomycetaceae bacterium]